MKYLKTFESFATIDDTVLFVVDIQPSFNNYFSDNYLEEVKKYCEKFSEVYQIFDNHIDGKDVDSDYLYSLHPIINTKEELYTFPNQKDILEKRYLYDVDSDYFRNIIDEKTLAKMEKLEKDNKLTEGMMFKTKYNTIVVYTGNNHQFFHCGLKLYYLLLDIKKQGKNIELIGGAHRSMYQTLSSDVNTDKKINSECIWDIYCACDAIVGQKNHNKCKINLKYTYSAKGSIIK